MNHTSKGGNEAHTAALTDVFADDLPADLGKATAHGRAYVDLDDTATSAEPAVAFPMLMVADRLGAEPGDEIEPYLSESQWEALRDFGKRHGIGIVAPNAVTDREGTRFEELDAVPPGVAVALCPDLDGTTRAEVAEFVAESVLYDMAEPEAALAELVERANARKRQRSQQQQVLKKVSVAPHTPYSLAEVERGCGVEVADAVRRMIEQHNRDTWNMGAAARKHRREEHTYLATAAELVGQGADVETIKALTQATAAEASAAWAELADARVRHKTGFTEDKNPVSRRWLDAQALASLPRVEYLLDKVLPSRSFVRISGMSETLKSFIAFDMALAKASGKPFLGSDRFPAGAPEHVIYVAGEGAQGVYTRIRAWCQRRKVDYATVMANLTILHGAAQFATRRDMADVAAKAIKTGAVLVVFDTQARCTVELEEDSATQMGKAIAAIDTLIQDTGVTALLLHHTPKGNPRVARGSISVTNAADMEFIAERDGRELAVSLEVTKSKDADKTGGTYPIKAVKVVVPGVGESLVLEPGADPTAEELGPDVPMDQWKGKGKAYVVPMYALAQEACISGEGLTQSRLADMANDVIRVERTAAGKERKIRRVCGKHTAAAAVKLLVDHGWLIVAKRQPGLGYVFYEPKDYLPLDPTAVSALSSTPPAA